MTTENLTNKPLVEAIFELKWAIDGPENSLNDPQYQILRGKLFEALMTEYPYEQKLPTAAIPESMAGHIVQHQFRVNENAWPLVQVGPGILTINETEGYTWSGFGSRIQKLIQTLFESCPDGYDININHLLLRYINAIELEEGESFKSCIHDKLSISVDFPESLFEKTNVSEDPYALNWLSSFKVNSPKGLIHLRFSSGKKADKKALILEQNFHAIDEDIPSMPTGFSDWLEGGHKVIEDWFFKLIEGDLEERFT